MELFLIKPIPTQRNYMLALDDCQDVRHLSSLAMHMNDITFSQRSFGKPYNKRVIFSFSKTLSELRMFPASPSPPAEHGGDTKPNAYKCCNLACKRKTPFLSSSDFLLHRGSEGVESKCLVDHTHSTFDKASFCRSVHYLRNAFYQNFW